MKALHLPHRRPTDCTAPFTFPANTAKPSDLLFSNDYTPPELPIQSPPGTIEVKGNGSTTGTTVAPQDGGSTAESGNSASSMPAVQNPSKRHQYLLQVITTSPTRGELTWRETLIASRFMTHRAPIPCHDVVGRILAVRSETGHFPAEATDTVKSAPLSEAKHKVGDTVYGLIDFERDGAAAEQVVVLESEISKLPNMPYGMSNHTRWEEMLATIPLAGLTAWQALFEHGGLLEPEIGGAVAINRDETSMTATDQEAEGSPKKRVLIIGASGAVGLLAVQIAHAARSSTQDVQITAICRTQYDETLHRIGAHELACYSDHQNNIESEVKRLAPFDLVLDLAGPPLLEEVLLTHRAIFQAYHGAPALLTSSGRILSIALPLTDSMTSSLNMKGVNVVALRQRYEFFIVRPHAEQLGKISKLLEQGRLEAFAHDAVFALHRGRLALEECEKRRRHELGKVVIRVSDATDP